jgi:hypothetical protein
MPLWRKKKIGKKRERGRQKEAEEKRNTLERCWRMKTSKISKEKGRENIGV